MFKRDTEIYNFSDPGTKAIWKKRIDDAEGLQCACLIPWHKMRTLPQQGYWFAVVIPELIEFFREGTGDNGWNAESVHYFAREMWLEPVETALPSGAVFKRPQSSTELDTAEYSKLIDSAINWMGDFGKRVPPPSHFERD